MNWLGFRNPSNGSVMKNAIHFPVRRDELPILRFALDHALSSISEAHPEDRAQLKALIERLEAAEKVTGKRSKSGQGS
jgi:hypothetical protein